MPLERIDEIRLFDYAEVSLYREKGTKIIRVNNSFKERSSDEFY